MTSASLTPSVPREIHRALGRVAARLRMVGTLKGLGTVAIVAAVGAVLGMTADFVWPLLSLTRWTIWAIWRLTS